VNSLKEKVILINIILQHFQFWSDGVVPIMFPTQDKIGSIKREDGDFKPSYDRLYSHDIPYSTHDLCCHNNVHVIHGDSGHSAVDKVNFRHSGMRTTPTLCGDMGIIGLSNARKNDEIQIIII
jgi:hypothetical protein